MLQLQNISKTYANSNRQIIDDLSFEIKAGESIAIVGSSGVGKSTLLNVMSTLDKVDEGSVLFENNDLQQLSNSEQATFRNEKMGFVFQQHQLLPQLNLIENVLLPTISVKDKAQKKAMEAKAKELIAKVGLSDIINQKPGQMSVGECQRTAVIRALINSPNIIFADEPTGSLDEDSALALVELLVQFNKEQKLTLIMVTHDLNLAQKLNRVMKLERGKLVELNKSM